MKKKVLIAVSYVLLIALTLTATVAYFTDTDSAVNVMTVGNIDIEQHEYQRAEGVAHNAGESGAGNGIKKDDLVPFVQKQTLMPAYPMDSTAYTAEATDLFYWGDYVYSGTAGNGLWNDEKLGNVMDKMVFVENTGKNDLYFRTIIAFECPEGMEYSEGPDKEFMMNINGSAVYEWESLGYITVDGVRYLVEAATYQNVLERGNQAHPSLLQVVMTHNATMEDAALLGDTYEILVLTQAIQADMGFEHANPNARAASAAPTMNAETALNAGFGAPLDKNVDDESKTNVEVWFKGVIDEHAVSEWDGTVDTSWYNETATEFTLTTAEQFAGLTELVDGGNTFEGKTINLDQDLDLQNQLFEPIGSYRKDTPFMGTFDGQGHTISNLSQNTWELDNGYEYSDLGLGLFGKVEDATVKNLVMDGVGISGESAICGTVAATAYGDCTFENITVKNANVADYQYYAGGIVGWASGDHKYINCNVDASSTIAAQWGDFDNSIGGVIGGAGGSAEILLKDCTVACRIDAYNDVTSSYQWYAYRRAGMLIGNTGKTVVEGETTYAAAPQLTCENVTVIYDDWANYTYCEFAGKSWPYVRVQAGVSNSAYSNPRYGHPTDANGNQVVDDNHVHNAGEDHFIECTFDQLYGGGQGVYGDPTHDGVTVIYNNK